MCCCRALGLLLTAPFSALAALGIKLSSAGPVLYRARRAGKGGEPFSMYKFRTMHGGASQGGRITGSSDPRVFRWGALLRGFKIDELPQLVNVLRGDMSMVGPRPEDVTIVRERYDAFMWRSLDVRPGITGPGSLDYFADEARLPSDAAAAEAIYLNELLPRKIALDLVYVRNVSLGYYLELMLRTVAGIVGLGRLFRRKAAWERDTAASYLVESGS